MSETRRTRLIDAPADLERPASLDRRRRRPPPCPVADLTLRSWIRSEYLGKTGATWMHPRQIDHMEAIGRLLARLEAKEGPFVHRTWRQLARSLGWADQDMTVKQTHSRFKNQFHRTLDYLTLIGLVIGWEPVYTDPKRPRKCTGVMIHVDGPVAQLVRATRSTRSWHFDRRAACPPTRLPVGDPGPDPPFFEATSVTPPKGLGGFSPVSVDLNNSHSRRRGLRHAPRPPGPAKLIAALESSRETLAERGGAAVVREHPWMAQAAPADFARAVLRVWPGPLKPFLSATKRARLERSSEYLDRQDGPGAGAAMVLNFAACEEGRLSIDLLDWFPEDFTKSLTDRKPQTLGAVAVALQRFARRRAGRVPKPRKAAARAAG